MEENANRAEAERLLGIAEKLLRSRDLSGSRDFAILAQETEPLLDGSDQILAVTDVLLSAEKRINNHHDWYSILQIDRRSDDLDLIKKQYRRLALLLHPDKNKFAFADAAFKLVADAWAVLSDLSKKSLYDNELSLYSKIDLVAMKNQRTQTQQNPQFRHPQQHEEVVDQQHQKLPVRRSSGGAETGGAGTTRLSSFWTACPYCYNLYQYPRVYEDCCLRCQNCNRSFQAVKIPSLPPLVPGKEAYYCCWGFFPLGFVPGNSKTTSGFPNWMPSMFPGGGAVANGGGGGGGGDGFVDVSGGRKAAAPVTAESKKRGRPKKNL